MEAFIMWALGGMLFIGVGIYTFFAKKPSGFWANAKMFEVEDVKGYNRAMGKLWCVFGAVFVLLGFPLLNSENAGLILLSVIGAMFEVIVTMAVYVIVIEKKYRRDSRE